MIKRLLIMLFIISTFTILGFHLEVNAVSERIFYNANDELGPVKEIRVHGDITLMVDQNNVLWAWGPIFKDSRTGNFEINKGIPTKLATNVMNIYLSPEAFSLQHQVLYYTTLNNDLFRLTNPLFNSEGKRNQETEFLNSPVLVGSNVVDVLTLPDNTYWINTNNELYGIGLNDYQQQLGSFIGSYSNDPVLLSTNVKKVFAKEYEDLFYIDTNDNLYTIKSTENTFIASNVVDVAGSSDQNYFLTKNGEVYKYNYGYTDLLLSNIRVLSSNDLSAYFAIDNSNKLFVWGNGQSYVLGNGSLDRIDTPLNILDNVSKIYPRHNAAFAITINGDLLAWGDDSTYIRDHESDLSRPKIVADNVRDITNYDDSLTFILKNDNSLWGAGNMLIQNGSNGLDYHPVHILDNVNKIITSHYADNHYAITPQNEVYTIGRGGDYVINNTSGLNTIEKTLTSSGGFGDAKVENTIFEEYASVEIYESDTTQIEIDIANNYYDFMTPRLGFEVYRSIDNINFKLIGITYNKTKSMITSNPEVYIFSDYDTEPDKQYYYVFRLIDSYKEYYDTTGEINYWLREYGRYSTNSYSFTSSFYVNDPSITVDNEGDYLISWTEDVSIDAYAIYYLNAQDQFEFLGESITDRFIPSFKINYDNVNIFKINPVRNSGTMKEFGCPQTIRVYHQFNDQEVKLLSNLKKFGEFKLDWEGIYLADHYEVYRTINYETPVLIYSGNNTEYLDAFSMQNVEHVTFRVKAFYYSSESQTSIQNYVDYDFSSYFQEDVDLQVTKVSETENKISWSNYDNLNIIRSIYPDLRDYVHLGLFDGNELIDNVTSTSQLYYYAAYHADENSLGYGSYYSFSNIVPSMQNLSEIIVNGSSSSSTSVYLSWNALSDFTHYEVSYSKGSSTTYTVLRSVTGLSTSHTGLSANTLYNYRVRAYKMSGTTKVYGKYSAITSVTTAPSSPVIKAVSKAQDTITVSWTKVSGATGYVLSMDGSEIETIADGNTVSVDIGGLEVGRSYGFSLVAKNGELRSAPSVTVNAIPVPAAVGNLQVSELDYDRVSLSWTAVVGAATYEVYQGTSSTAVTSKVGSVSEGEFTTSVALKFNTTYYYKVVPMTANGILGSASSVVSAKTALKSVEGLSASLNGTSANLNWQAVNGAGGYEVSYSKGSSTTYTVLRSVTGLSTSHTGLSANTLYNYRVRAYKMSGTTKVYGKYSDVVQPSSDEYEAINLVASSDLNSLDNLDGYDDLTFYTRMNVIEGLVRNARTGGYDVEKGVATSWTFNSLENAWIISLNPNSFWVNHLGEKVRSVTANDFVTGWDRIRSEYGLGSSTGIVDFEVTNSSTLKIYVNKKEIYFMELLTSQNFLPIPADYLVQYGDEYGSSFDKTLYNGPFYVSDVEPGVSYTWKKNDYYWDKNVVKTPQVNILVKYGLFEERLAVFEEGNADLLSIYKGIVPEIGYEIDSIRVPNSTVFYLLLNQVGHFDEASSNYIPNLLISNLKVRQAMSLFLDKNYLQTEILKEGNEPANYFIPSKKIKYNGEEYEANRGNGYMLMNRSTAATLLSEGMIELGIGLGDNNLSIDLISINGSTMEVAIIEQLNQLFSSYGVTINRRVLTAYDFYNSLYSNDFDLALTGWGLDYSWPTSSLNLFTEGNSMSYQSYSNITFDQLLDTSDKTYDEIWHDLKEAEKLLIEDVAVIPLHQRISFYKLNSDLKDIQFVQDNSVVSFKYAYKLKE